MEQDNLLNYLYTMLKNQHLWFVSKTDNTGIYWQTKPKKYYTLDEYGEIKDKKKVEKEINDYLGDGAETISEAVALFIADGVCDGSISQIDYLNMNFKDKPVEYSENAIEVKNIEPKYIKPEITGSNKQVESKQLTEKINPKYAKFYAEVKSNKELANEIDYLFRKVKENDYKYTFFDKEYIDTEVDKEMNRSIEDKVADILENASLISNLAKPETAKKLNSLLDESKKQEDIFDDVTNGKATYGVYDDKDERNLKDRYKEPTYAKRNKIRNFKDDKFTQRSVRDIINKGVTHVDYEKMPNERVQAYKNSKKEEDYFDKMDKLRKDAENKMINSLKREFPEAKVSDVIESKYAGDRILLTNNGKRVTIYFMDEQGEDGKPWFMVIKNKANKESYSGNIEDIIKYIKTNIFNAIKKVENVQRRLNEENNKSLNLISDMFKSKDFDSDSKAGQIVMRTSNLFNVLSDKGYDVQVSFDNGESTNTILLGQQGGSILITITDVNQPLRAFTNGSFEITEDNLKVLEDVSKEIKTI